MKNKEKKLKMKEVVGELLDGFFEELESRSQRIDVLPIEVQIDILQKTTGFLSEIEKGKNGFREQLEDREMFSRKSLRLCAQMLAKFYTQLRDTEKAVEDAITMINAETDARDIGKSPSDKALIKDEKNRSSRLEIFRKRLKARQNRFVQKGDDK